MTDQQSKLTLEKIKGRIKKWDDIRNTAEGFKLLTSGSGIRISKENYTQLKEQRSTSKYIHLYLGAVPTEGSSILKMQFYLIDSTSDKETIDKQKIIIKEFITPKGYSNTNETSILESIFSPKTNSTATEEATGYNYLLDILPVLRWLLYGHRWFAKAAPNNNVARVFRIPFSDFKDIFENADTDHAFLVFAKRTPPVPPVPPETIHENSQMDIYILKHNSTDDNTNPENFIAAHPTKDTTTPYPPYTIPPNQFNLL
jgi:hypothetical protein